MEIERVIENVLAFAFALTVLGCATKVALTLINRRRQTISPELEEIRERLNRIEQAVDATAIEVERVAEAHRFTSRLLAERLPEVNRMPRMPGQVTTPH